MTVGIGALLHLMSGGSEQFSDKYIGRKIVAAEMSENQLNIEFEDGVRIAIFDDGQSCCERRYMSTDDDPASLVGHRWVEVTAEGGPRLEEEYETHEQVFVTVKTDGGLISIVNHNEHNGYYGGFGLTIKEATP